ncbi:hypothetical protein QVD17_06354 [Tagetes erecta]|uniref:F-box domain, Leucine-rich repeat domain, L domain-like protein n=1 Tax=Tagetes erecta TaxID=13708 RepID=A0AAD8LK08_TARER|nr:hypothetical protein QVD17_06354 [Tagetes erecta]
MDLISQLPESIVHRILSTFKADDAPPVELVRMSVLSKTWFHLTSSFPVLDFNIENFVTKESFFKYVEYTTSRFCQHNVTAKKLTFIANFKEPVELDIINRCVELLLKNGVHELVIDVVYVSYSARVTPRPKYRLPNVLLSVSVLKSLTIQGCELPSSLMVDGVQFKSLIQLALEYIVIDEEVITYLTTSCPLLQDFQVKGCHGFKRFCVYGHQNLEKVKILQNTQVERIDIDAPNLSTLLVKVWEGKGTPQMNLASCKKLRIVTYIGDVLPNSNGSTDFLTNFPFVETLLLDTTSNNLKLSSHSLKTLELLSTCNLEDIEFRTPNLCYLHSREYYLLFQPMMEPSCVSSSTHLKASMHCYPGGYIEAWFQKLRRFLDKKNGLQVLNLYINTTGGQKFRELEKLKAIELPPYELEYVELQLDIHESSSAHIAFVDAALLCCRPRSLTLKSSSPLTDIEEQSDIVKFTYEKLLEQEDEGRTKIQIVPSSSCKAQKLFRRVLPPEGKAICFIKEERTHFIS